MPYKTPWLKDKNAGIVKIRNAVGDTTTQTGNPVSVDNEFGLGEVDSLSVALNPVQNLNGYDSPWIGGAGKNLCADLSDYTITHNGITFTFSEGHRITIHGTSTANNADSTTRSFGGTNPKPITFKAGVTYTASISNITASPKIRLFLRKGTSTNAWYGDSTTGVWTFSFAEDTVSDYFMIRVPTKDSVVDVDGYFQIEEGSTKTDWAPYENICPIYPANGKNLLQTSATTQTINGVTFTVNADGTISLSGTSTDRANFSIPLSASLADGNYILSGCPSGGSGTTYYQQAFASSVGKGIDQGSGVEIIDPSTVTRLSITIRNANIDTTGIVFKPMIRRADIADATYQPYQGIMVEQVGKNLLKYPYFNRTSTVNGVTFTVNTDGTITATGQATATAIFYLESNLPLKAGTYIVSGEDGASSSTYRYRLYNNSGTISYVSSNDYTLTLAEDSTINMSLYVYSGYNPSGKTFHPMIREASVTDGTFEPYTERTYPMTLGQDVYGGSIDLATGVLTIDRVSVTVDGSTGSGSSGVQNSSAENPNGKLYIYRVNQTWFDGFRQTTLSDRHIRSTASTGTTIGIGEYFSSAGSNGTTTNTYFVCPDPTVTDITGVRAWLAEHPFQFVYGLTDPITVQLTPAQIELLKGMNYISSSDDITFTVTLPGWTSLIDPSKIKHDIYDLDAGNTTGRNLAGEMLRDRVAVKEKLNLEFPPIVADDYYAMLNLIKDQFFDVLYYSPFTGGKRVATMYVGDREGEPYYDYDVNDHANNMWTNVKFNFIER